ncbi:hypothetical protein [Nocardioides sp.]|uniref:hypothetical protein n=1 Tax=Nocardioides sp. TaxID=35761 RepID=UPI0035283918
MVGTALGALFLAQLSQLVATFTQATAVQNIVQALIIGVGIVAQLQFGGGLVEAPEPRRRESKSRHNVTTDSP